VIVDQPFLNEFVRLARDANYWVHLAPSTRIRTASSLLPLYERLKQSHAHQVNIEWDPLIKDMVLQLSLEKQRQYSAVIKYVQKRLTGQESKIFATLRRALPGGGFLSEKLSKAQQRYVNSLVGEAGHGVCLQMALLWLQEQLGAYPPGAGPQPTLFPRLAREDVVKSETARELGRRAVALAEAPGVLQPRNVRLSLPEINGAHSFDNFHTAYATNATVRAFLIAFNNTHAVAIFREGPLACQFFDANAGSYRIVTANIRAFLLEYNNVCLPRKWAGYARPAASAFDHLWEVSRR